MTVPFCWKNGQKKMVCAWAMDPMLHLNGTIFIVACFLSLFLLFMNKNKKAPILIIRFREVEGGGGGRSFIFFCFVLFCFNELEEFLNI